MNENLLINLVSEPNFHEDYRRRIVDVTSRIKLFTIPDMEGLKLGNHYHEHTPEMFYIQDGKVHFKLENTKTQKRQEYTVEPGQSIEMPLCVAHQVLPEPRSLFLGILGEDFDPNDLIKYEITW